MKPSLSALLVLLLGTFGCASGPAPFDLLLTGGELLDWLKDGSIGVAHYGRKFKIPG